MTGCQPVSTDLRTVLLISGISIVPIAGIARAACWMMRVSGFKRFADALQHVKRRRPPPPPSSSSSSSPASSPASPPAPFGPNFFLQEEEEEDFQSFHDMYLLPKSQQCKKKNFT